MSDQNIVTHGLTKRFGEFTAVDHVELSVAKGEVFGFLGSNGCGKTTTIRMLCGLLRPTDGEASVAGLDVATEAEAIRARVGYVAQFFNLYRELTVRENLMFYGGVYGVPNDRLPSTVDQWCQRLDLERYQTMRAGDLSTGVQRTLALAAAVLHDPAVLLLDEPTSGVDPLARRAFFDVIGELAQRGTTVLVTTHVMDEAERCHRLALMNRGRIIFTGTPAAIKQQTAREIYRIPVEPPGRALTVAEQLPGVASAALFGRELQVSFDHDGDAAQGVVANLTAQGINCQPPRHVRPTIEHAFLELLRLDERQRTNGEAA